MPDLSKIDGDPKAPAESTTTRDARVAEHQHYSSNTSNFVRILLYQTLLKNGSDNSLPIQHLQVTLAFLITDVSVDSVRSFSRRQIDVSDLSVVDQIHVKKSLLTLLIAFLSETTVLIVFRCDSKILFYNSCHEYDRCHICLPRESSHLSPIPKILPVILIRCRCPYIHDD